MCSMRTSDASRRGSGTDGRCSRLPVRRRRVARRELESVAKRGPEDGVAVAAATGRAGQVDDERRADEPGNAAGEERVRRPRDRVRPNRLGDTRCLAVELADASPPA